LSFETNFYRKFFIGQQRTSEHESTTKSTHKVKSVFTHCKSLMKKQSWIQDMVMRSNSILGSEMNQTKTGLIQQKVKHRNNFNKKGIDNIYLRSTFPHFKRQNGAFRRVESSQIDKKIYKEGFCGSFMQPCL
jgi:hypothetical protein